ncbi:MAG: LUD domain-containing protein [Acidimicrobiales bacterium]
MRLVATPADVLHPFTGHGEDLPANLVIVTGPSRTGDIEQILTIGVHGPVAVHIALV